LLHYQDPSRSHLGDLNTNITSWWYSSFPTNDEHSQLVCPANAAISSLSSTRLTLEACATRVCHRFELTCCWFLPSNAAKHVSRLYSVTLLVLGYSYQFGIAYLCLLSYNSSLFKVIKNVIRSGCLQCVGPTASGCLYS
jgi:hypothetical protein